MKLKKGIILASVWTDGPITQVAYPGLLSENLGIIQFNDEAKWDIVHLKTGYCVANGLYFNTLREARSLLEKFETTKGLNWDFSDPTKVSKLTRKTSHRILKEARGI